MNEEQVLEGIKKSIQNIVELLDSSEKVVSKESDNSIALGLYSFAIEEFGKALLLKEILLEKNSKYSVPIDIFTGRQSHELKFKKALDSLPVECKYAIPGTTISTNSDSKSRKIVLTPRGDSMTLPPGITGTFSMIGNFPTDFEMRMNCFYVDWDDSKKEWKHRPKLLAESIGRGVWKFKKELTKFEHDLKR